MHMRTCLVVLLLLAAPRAFGAVCANPQDPAALGIDLSQQASCDPLVPEQCMLPFPNDYFTVADTEHAHAPAHPLHAGGAAEERRRASRSRPPS